VLGLCFLAAQANAEDNTELKTMKDQVSYGIGVNIARSFKADEIEFDPDLVLRGLRDASSGEKLLMREKELKHVMNSFQGELRQKAALKHRLAAIDNKKEGETFLAANKEKDGVLSLPSGVQYTVLKMGDGKKPADTDMWINYRGTRSMEPIRQHPRIAGDLRSLAHPGWKDALKLMPEGSGSFHSAAPWRAGRRPRYRTRRFMK
jgi:FKBP-type peptidyl-prolyl cis-trans isomerase FklB